MQNIENTMLSRNEEVQNSGECVRFGLIVEIHESSIIDNAGPAYVSHKIWLQETNPLLFKTMEFRGTEHLKGHHIFSYTPKSTIAYDPI